MPSRTAPDGAVRRPSRTHRPAGPRRLAAVSRPLRRTSRRAALGAGLTAGLGLTGTLGACSTSSTPATPRPAPRATASGSGAAATDRGNAEPDTALVASVLDAVSLVHAQVRANRRAHASLSVRLRGLERLHARHAAELGGLAVVTAPAAELRTSQVVAALASVEDRLQRRLVGACVDAESGALALLLASMAAGVAQERTRL